MSSKKESKETPKVEVMKAANPSGVELHAADTLKVTKKVDPASVPRRCRALYERLLKGNATVESLAGDDPGKRWSCRILVKMKLTDVEKAEPKEPPKTKAKKSPPRKSTTKKATAKPAEAKPESPQARRKAA